MSHLALSRFLVPWLQQAWPLDWTAIFGRAAPLALEIGFGNGAFLAENARRRPAWNWIGIERSWASLQRLMRRLERQGLENVRALEGDGGWLVAHAFAPGILSEVFLNFPDPWPKARHHGRRLIRPGFVRVLGEKLRVGGRVTIATDHPGYAAWIAEVLQAQQVLRPALGAPSVHELAGRIPTKYEAKARARGARIYYFVWEKARSVRCGERFHRGTPRPAAPSPTPAEEGESMPNVVLRGPLSPEAVRALQGLTWQERQGELEVLIKCEAVYRALDGGAWLVELLVKERLVSPGPESGAPIGELNQHAALGLYPQGRDRWLLKPSPIGYPRPTWGLKRAVGHVARALLARAPEVEVLASTVGTLKRASR